MFSPLLSEFSPVSLRDLFWDLCFSMCLLTTDVTQFAHSKYLLFADDIKIFRAVDSAQDCYLLQSDINSVQGWCTANCMKLNIGKTRVISFSRKTNALIYDHKLCQSSITRSHSIKDLGVFLIINFTSMTMSTYCLAIY
jgi:hypothetical protein